MRILSERVSGFREIYLQTVQECNKSYIELIALYVPPKIAIISWSQYIRLGKQILGKQNQAQFFAFDKFTLQNLNTSHLT